ncbi:hypothetical protein NDU88_005036, partial [Pleurodeles waltl]
PGFYFLFLSNRSCLLEKCSRGMKSDVSFSVFNQLDLLCLFPQLLALAADIVNSRFNCDK